MNKSDYHSKMLHILNVKTKFFVAPLRCFSALRCLVGPFVQRWIISRLCLVAMAILLIF